MNYRPLFVVPRHLTDNIMIKPEPTHNPLKPGRKPDPMTRERQRQAHIKGQLRRRHSQHIDQSIAKLEKRLAILKEIRDEM
jgi:hypothetical protein